MHTSTHPETTHNTTHLPDLIWEQDISTGSASEQEINCKYLKVIAFYPNSGNLY